MLLLVDAIEAGGEGLGCIAEGARSLQRERKQFSNEGRRSRKEKMWGVGKAAGINY